MGKERGDLHQEERILVVGGSGWIGRALQQVLTSLHCQVLSLDSTAASTEFSAKSGRVHAFQPTTAIFVAGVTPDRGAEMGVEAYSGALDRVTATLENVIHLPSLSRVCYASSGIVNADRGTELDPIRRHYRSAKLREERLVQSSSTEGDPLIARVYSLSGPYARCPDNYALFDFIRQSRTGAISIRSDSLVYRSYSSVMDLAHVLVYSLASQRGGTFSTGGHPIELGELAHEVAATAAGPVRVEIPEQRTRKDFYCGNDTQWRRWCAESGVVSKNLREQITASIEWLERRRSN